MYKGALKGLIEKLVEQQFGGTAFSTGMKDAGYDMVNFKVHTCTPEADVVFHVYKGFIGTVGNVKVYEIDGDELETEDWIDLV